MPTIRINRLTGSGPTATDITSTTNRADAADDPADGTANPIAIPASGTNYSFWVSTQLNCTVAPTTLVWNLAWYTTGTNPFGADIDMTVIVSPSYIEATGTDGVSGDEAWPAFSSIAVAGPTEAFSIDSSSPQSVDGSTSITGLFGDILVYQIDVSPGAAAGVVAGAALVTWTYDYD